MQEKSEVVPLAALVCGAISFLTPFAALKENRVVDGVMVTGADLAGDWILALSIILGFSVLLAALFMPSGKSRRLIYAISGSACIWLSAALLVRGGAGLPSGVAPRVSPAIGFWGLPAASYILIIHSDIVRKRRGKWIMGLVLLLPVVLIFSSGRGDSISVYREWTARKARFLNETLAHMRLFVTAVLSATLIGIPLGILASRSRRFTALVIGFVDTAQTIPSMALFGLLMAPLAALSRAYPAFRTMGIQGVGAAPALIALTLYALLPIVRNTVTGLASVPAASLDAGWGMGMSPRQLFFRVKWPMALPHVLTGLRTASVQGVGNTAVAALIGAGGLGIMIFQGLGQAAPDLILLGVLPLILMALITDRGWDYIIQSCISPGLRLPGNK